MCGAQMLPATAVIISHTSLAQVNDDDLTLILTTGTSASMLPVAGVPTTDGG